MQGAYWRGVGVLLGVLVVAVIVGSALNAGWLVPVIMLPALNWFFRRYRRIVRGNTRPEGKRELREVQRMHRLYFRVLIPLIAIPVAAIVVMALATQ